MKPGDTFLGGGEVHGEDHLWLVINDPSAHGGVALIVNVSTLRPNAETTCLVQQASTRLSSTTAMCGMEAPGARMWRTWESW